MPGFKRTPYKDAYDRLARTAKADGFTLKGVTMARDEDGPIPSYEDIYGVPQAPSLCPLEHVVGEHDRKIRLAIDSQADLLRRVNKIESTLRRISDAV